MAIRWLSGVKAAWSIGPSAMRRRSISGTLRTRSRRLRRRSYRRRPDLGSRVAQPRATISGACALRVVGELRIPVFAAATGRHVEHDPDRHDVGGTARILAGVCCRRPHFVAPEVADDTVRALEYVERRIVTDFGIFTGVIEVEAVVGR